jgi:KUP system potassium uptake protein
MTKPAEGEKSGLAVAALGALGVVYGDIGTSPLYSLRECFHGPHAIEATPLHVLGVMSLIFWSLVLVISVKYLAFVMRADNNGEGGILALMALVVKPDKAKRASVMWVLLMVGLFGSALLYGDGVITPAISVLSAVEGLEIATPVFTPYVIPIAVAILVGLFAIQSRGTAKVGFLFGPVTLLWFISIAALGIRWIATAPRVLFAASPHYAVQFFMESPLHAFLVLGAVFLVVTGGEALYADMGHFGKRPIQWAWFAVALPALLVNYFGQGALLLQQPELASSPFFHMAPRWALYPLVILATMATVIASQAVITGSYSLTWQALQLGYLPRIEVRHTSEDEKGQIYIPEVTWALLCATLLLVFEFRSSSRLAAAYGIAVTSTMVITTILLAVAMRKIWKWKLPVIIALCSFFAVIDLAFLGANAVKIADGGWFPLLVGASVMVLMTTWRRGREILYQRLQERALRFSDLLARIEETPPLRSPGVAVYMTGNPDWVPPALMRLLEHTGALHERVVTLTVDSTQEAYVDRDKRADVEEIGPGVFRVVARYGFMERPNIPLLLRRLQGFDPPIDPDKVTYVLGRETLLATERPGMALWREKLFAFMSRNAGRATSFFNISPDRVLEVGAQIEL